MALGVVGYCMSLADGDFSDVQTVDVSNARSPHAIALDSVKIADFEWKAGGFDNVMIAEFTIANQGSRPVKDLGIECTMTAASGTVVDRIQKTLFERLEPGQTRRFREVNMGLMHSQSQSASCGIQKVVAE